MELPADRRAVSAVLVGVRVRLEPSQGYRGHIAGCNVRIADFPTFPPRVRRVEQPAVYRWTLSWPPSANNAFINNPHTGGRFLSASAKEWKAAARDLIAGTSPGVRLPAEPLAFHIRLFPKATKSGKVKAFDTDGKIKVCLDALVASGLLDDDTHARVPFVSACVMAPDGNGRVELAVELFSAWHQRVGGNPWP